MLFSGYFVVTLYLSWGGNVALAQIPELHRNFPSFADALTKQLYQQPNECTSALGISMAFSLIYPSASGESLSEIQSVLNYPVQENHRQLLWNATSTRLDQTYSGLCTTESTPVQECGTVRPLLEIANSVWIDNDFNLDADYAQVVGELLQQIEFEDDNAGGIVNEWVNASTNGLIDSIVKDGPLFPPLILLAVNSLYLKAGWLNQFEMANTNRDTFYASAARSTPADAAHFMHMVDYFMYSHEAIEGFQIVRMSFAGGRLSFLLALPLEEETTMLSSTTLIPALDQLQRTRLALAIPKFLFESKYEASLENALKAIGLEAPFETGLCVRENSCDAFIDFVIQKTFIDVNEEGVEAAAVTAIGVTESAGIIDENIPTLVLADTPFQFFIYDANEELMIFEGRVGDPGIPEGAPSAQLQKSHADPDFWMSTFNVEPKVVEASNTSTSVDPSSNAFQMRFAVEAVALVTTLLYGCFV